MLLPGTLITFAHAFGQRYELPLPLALFVFGGAAAVFFSFLLVTRRKVGKQRHYSSDLDHSETVRFNGLAAAVSFIVLAGLILIGLLGSQEVPENILPTVFWLVVWIAVPLSCGLIGNWTQILNPFAAVTKLVDTKSLRRTLLGRDTAFAWPRGLGWWPAVALYFALACGELIYNQAATRPAVIAIGLLVYLCLSAFAGLLYGKAWLRRGEVFTVLYATWGRLGLFRFGAAGNRGLAGGLSVPFEATPSRVAFLLLLLVSVSFDGLISTPAWSTFQHNLSANLSQGTGKNELLSVAIFLLLGFVIWTLFTLFAVTSVRISGTKQSFIMALTRLLPSLLPISYGYLLAHNFEYLITNGQLLFPLIGNPTGLESWPLHLGYPFNDSFEPNIHVLPSAYYWYIAVLVIIVVHVIAVVLAHRQLGSIADKERARRSEYPWVIAMVAYTMLSLWLLAQPLVKEKPAATGESFLPTETHLKSDS